jgi:predicted Zn-ribbon and HTH transcriptional regulator
MELCRAVKPSKNMKQNRTLGTTETSKPAGVKALASATGSAYRPLAHKDGITLVFGLLMASGAMCPKCGFGTRVTSKKWARCKKCGERVERVKMSDIKVVVGRPPGMPNDGLEPSARSKGIK